VTAPGERAREAGAGGRLYEAVAEDLARQIRDGVLAPGERLPSVRLLCRQRRISPATAVRAYALLEDRGLAEPRARSGYFVRATPGTTQAPPASTPPRRATRLDVSELVFEVLEASRNRRVLPLGSAFPGPELFPWAALARQLGSSVRRMDPWDTVESLTPGHEELRRQIARRYLEAGVDVALEEIVITSGALEALNLGLRAVTRPGDTVAIESPTFYGALQAIEAAGLRAVEVATDPRDGIDLAALAAVLESQPVRACWLMTTLQNPLGATMSEDKKAALVALLARHGTVLLEDDVYAELQFGPETVRPAKAFDRRGNVLHCGSFAKCLAPGYRVGWIAAGRHATAVARAKITTSLATSVPMQLAIAQYLRHGGYDAHLRRLRGALQSQQRAVLEAIARRFPPGCRVSRPSGGYFLWVDCGPGVDALEVHRRALDAGIGVAPGPIFSARRAFGTCLRINTGHPWTPGLDRALAELGTIVAARPVAEPSAAPR
jgi:DNA-binding transcriptional MocR family regulator